MNTQSDFLGQRTRWKQIWPKIVDNYDTLIAIALSIVAAVAGTFGGGETLVLSALAVTMAILAGSIIRDRAVRNEFQADLRKLDHALHDFTKGNPTALAFFKTRRDLPPLAEQLPRARALDMSGASLFSFSVENQSLLRQLKESGAKIRMLTSNPNNTFLQHQYASTFLEAHDVRFHSDQVRMVIGGLAPLVGDSSSGGSLLLRMTDEVAAFSYAGIDTDKPYGRIQIQLYLKSFAYTEAPTIVLEKATDPYWFEVFRSQFERMWQAGVKPELASGSS